MKLFISYARIDKPYCVQLVHTLDVHDVWYDQRLYAGQQWWKEILRRLDWCDGFIYLLSPESVQSEYCLKELDIALKLKRPVIPVLVQPDTVLPAQIADMQYVDITRGLTAENMRVLLNSLYLAEHALDDDSTAVNRIAADSRRPPVANSAKIITQAAHAMQIGQYDRAVFLLKQAKEKGYQSKYVNLARLLEEAERALEKQSKEREAQRDYLQIVELFQYSKIREIALEAFEKFQEVHPDYDPQGLKKYLQNGKRTTQSVQVMVKEPKNNALPKLQWCMIPGGVVTMQGQPRNETAVAVEDFWISKYPVTNLQFDMFVNNPDGYSNDRWWHFSEQAENWFYTHPEPLQAHFKGEHRPRETVNWYEAIAFCNWLSHHLNQTVTLPSLAQWQRAAVGDAETSYPWGNIYLDTHCNTREGDLKMTTPVDRYPEGRSLYDVYDMAGNIWEWTVDCAPPDEAEDDVKRGVIGGSFVSPCDRAQLSFRYYLKPEARYSSIGIRLVILHPSANLSSHLKFS